MAKHCEMRHREGVLLEREDTGRQMEGALKRGWSCQLMPKPAMFFHPWEWGAHPLQS